MTLWYWLHRDVLGVAYRGSEGSYDRSESGVGFGLTTGEFGHDGSMFIK